MAGYSTEYIIQLWKDTFSSKLSEYSIFDAGQKFHQIVNICSPGRSFYYILNFSDLSFDFIHPNVEKVIGKSPTNLSLADLLNNSPQAEIKLIQQKEKITTDFFYNFLREEKYLSYKILYTYRCIGKNNRIQTMLIQSTPISISENGKIEHVFGLHTDISYLGNVPTDWVSFISLDGDESYLNIKAEHERFNPNLANLEKSAITKSLTKREKEIIKLLSQGLTAQAIAEELFISFNTVRTHRKNILAKTNCQNTTELIGKCLSEGLI